MGSRGRSGRLVIEALIALLVIGAVLAGTGDVFREGGRLRARFAAEATARSALASDLARLRGGIDGTAPLPDRVVSEFAHDTGVAGDIEHRLAVGEPGTVVVASIVRWRAGEHAGEIARRLVVRSGR